MEKKEINNEELKNVNGGGMYGRDTITCPNCHKTYYGDDYNPKKLGSRCSDETEYTCPSCGHVFRE